MNSFVNSVERVNVAKKPGFERYSLQTIIDEADEEGAKGEGGSSMWSTLSSMWSSPPAISSNDTSADPEEFIHVFSLATGHMYERLLRIMMLSVIKRTSVPVKFWLFENYLSPKFKALASTMAQEYGFQVNYVTYKWPEWYWTLYNLALNVLYLSYSQAHSADGEAANHLGLQDLISGCALSS